MKVALVAMSGVRVRSPRMRELGVTLPGFVRRGEIIASMPSLALLQIAGCTPDGVELSYHEVADLERVDLSLDADLVAISTYTAQAFEAYRLADRLRAQGTRVVLGGLHATQCPAEAAEHADAVAVGEGELLWPRILEDFQKGSLRPLYREERPGQLDLDSTPLPRFDLLDMGRYNRVTVQTSRGCPHLCEFCASSVLFGPGQRRKSVARVLAEVDRVLELWPDRSPFLEFADDNTFTDRRWGKELLRGLAERSVSWFAETDLSIASDPELLDLLRPSGCRQLLLGFESPTRAALEGIDARNWKLRKHGEHLRAIEAIQSRGVTVNGCFIVGLDGHGPEVFQDVFDFVRASGLFEVQVTVPTPFPGTPLYRRLKSEGRLLGDRFWDRSTLFDLNFVPRRMSVEELEDGVLWLYRELYSETEVARRRRLLMERLRTLKHGERAA
jgi:radical SAM superfamily enzyme YgiQ (UPF0313 family)